MVDSCPVCGDDVEHVRREGSGESSSHPEAIPGPHTATEVAQLCGVAEERQWDRICHRAAIEGDDDDKTSSPVLDVFYHHFR